MSAIAARAVLALLATATVATTVATLPAAAAVRKPKVVVVPANVIADPAARVCMPRTTSPLVAKDKTLPETLCETTEGWATRGVTLRAK